MPLLLLLEHGVLVLPQVQRLVGRHGKFLAPVVGRGVLSHARSVPNWHCVELNEMPIIYQEVTGETEKEKERRRRKRKRKERTSLKWNTFEESHCQQCQHPSPADPVVAPQRSSCPNMLWAHPTAIKQTGHDAN